MIPKIRNILYASDLSDNSVPALAWAMALAHKHDARITFLHVIEEVAPHTAHSIRAFMGDEQWQKLLESQKSDANHEINERIHHFCEKVKTEMADCPLVVKQTKVLKGVPSEVIANQCKSNEFDLVVMGTHGGGVFKGAMIGSTARRVLRRTQTPVFVIPLTESSS